MKKKFTIVLCFIAICFATGCENDKTDIEEIKKGKLNACSDYTIAELVDNYMESPKWTVEKSDKGYNVYNVKGNVYYKGDESNALIQFAIDNDDIIVKAFEVNKVSKPGDEYVSLVKDMCRITKEKKEKEEYKDWLDNERDEWLKQQNVKLLNIPEDYVLFHFPIDTIGSYGNSYYPGDYVDLWKYDTEIKKPVRVVTNVEILQVLDKDGNHVFEPFVDNRYPAELILAIPKEYDNKLDVKDLVTTPTGGDLSW